MIDEWDCIFRMHKSDLESQKKYLDFLRNLLKDQSYVALAYMTGILPIKKYGEHSALNMFTEISMTDPRECAEFTGFKAIRQSDGLLDATLQGDEKKVAEIVEQVHQDNTSILQYNDENSLSCVLSLAYYSAQKSHMITREAPAGKGYADLVFVPRRNNHLPALIVELKCDHSAEKAVEQIRKKDYTDCLKDYIGEIVLVGINYDKKSKKHTCRIEKIKK